VTHLQATILDWELGVVAFVAAVRLLAGWIRRG
jgi:hypothetical protein